MLNKMNVLNRHKFFGLFWFGFFVVVFLFPGKSFSPVKVFFWKRLTEDFSEMKVALGLKWEHMKIDVKI